MKKNRILKGLFLCISPLLVQAQCEYEEKDGLVIIEAEDLDLHSDWHIKTEKAGYTGSSYITWEGGDNFNNPGEGTITTKIKINKTGTYRFQWRNAVGEGTNTTEFNDSWLKFPDADDFYGQKGSNTSLRVYPKGSGKTPEPEGSGSDGWFKIYTSSTTDWNWTSKTSDNDAHDIYVQFDNPGVYTMLISGRSDKHALDRISLSNEGDGATDNNTAATVCGNETSCTDITLNAIEDFTNTDIDGFSPAYVDDTRGALAIDAAIYQDEYAAASSTFEGVTGQYNFTLNTMSELDGESSYKIMINGVQVGTTFQNPSTSIDYSPASVTFNRIDIENGDEIRIEFSSHTNGLIPEGNGTAFSRGRWTSLQLECSTGDEITGGPEGSPITTPDGVTIDGEFRRWHKITLTCDGPNTSEDAATNPFMDYRLDVTFTNTASGQTMVIPGYYSGCDDPTDGCNSGNKWKVHISPSLTGDWSYSFDFTTGSDVAINGGGSSAGFFDSKTGSFSIGESDKTGRDFRAADKGVLSYVGEHYLRFTGTGGDQPNGNYFVKAGADAPENMLAYEDFDATPNRGDRRKSWDPHQQDYLASDASEYTWGDNDGTEILGVVNYLSTKGVNAFSFLTLSLHGDDENVFPYLMKVNENTYNGYDDSQQWDDGVYHDRFDVSKLAQWERVFEYGDKKGMFMHFKTLETENDNIMDDNSFGDERKIYYRELIARFGHHLALNWNLTEESTLPDNVVQQTATYIKDVDPYDHHRVLHTYPGQQAQRYDPLLGNNSDLTGASVQTDKSNVHDDVLNWINKSAAAGKKWVVCNDEQGDHRVGVDEDGTDDDLVREEVLWGTFMAGGMGVEYYYGYQTGETDLSAQTHRTRDLKYTHAAHALHFFETYLLDYIVDMESSDDVTSEGDDYVFAKPGQLYVVYRPYGGTTAITLPSGDWTVQWFNPRTGGGLTNSGAVSNSLVAPDNNDWVALITGDGIISTNESPNVSFTTPTLSDIFFEGDSLGVLVDASDNDGTVENVKLYLDNVLIRQESLAPYNWGVENLGQDDLDLYNLAMGTYTLKAVAEDNEGATSEVSLEIEVFEKGLVTRTSENDAYLQGAGETNNNNEDLRVEDGNRVTYIMFDISGIDDGILERAELELSVSTDEGNGEILVYQAGNSWQETSINGTNKPNKLSEMAITSLNTNYELGNSYTFDVGTADFSGDQITFVIEMNGGNDVSFASKESNVADGPKLILKVDEIVTELEDQEVDTMDFYPNPTSSTITLSNNVEWVLYSTMGVVISSGVSHEVDLSGLSSGTYFISLDGHLKCIIKE